MSTIRCVCGEVHTFDERDTTQTLSCRCGRVLEMKPFAEHGLVAWAEGRERKRTREVRRSWTLLIGVLVVVLGLGAWIGRAPLRRAATVVLASTRRWTEPASRQAGPSPATSGSTPARPNAGTQGSPRGDAPASAAIPGVPATGTWILRPTGPRGRGSLRIDNVSSRDAVARLMSGGHSWCEVYLRSRTGFTVSGIPSGSYRLRFALGSDWDPRSMGFRLDPSDAALGEELRFGVTDQDGIRYMDAQHVTLRGPEDPGSHEFTVSAYSDP